MARLLLQCRHTTLARANMNRIFHSTDFLRASHGEPTRSVVTESPDAAIVAWHVEPGQRIAAHVHPDGQDTWTVLSGEGDYQTDAAGSTQRIAAGDVVVAPRGAVHGVVNRGAHPLVFIAVVSPALSGFELL